MSDFLKADLSRKYPDLMPYVKVTLLQSAQSILTTVGSRFSCVLKFALHAESPRLFVTFIS